MDRLVGDGHELVMFDVNRSVRIEPLMKIDPQDRIDAMFADPHRTFDLAIITNARDDAPDVVEAALSGIRGRRGAHPDRRRVARWTVFAVARGVAVPA